MTHGFCPMTTFPNENCLSSGVSSVLAMSSVGSNLVFDVETLYKSDSAIASAVEKPYIYLQQTGNDSKTWSIANVAGCHPAYLANTFSGYYTSLASLCVAEAPFVQIRLFSTTSCASTTDFHDLSAVVIPHSAPPKEGPVSTYFVDGLKSTAIAKCYGDVQSTAVGINGVVLVSSSSTSCNSPTSSYYFANSLNCEPVVVLGGDAPTQSSVKLSSQCSSSDNYLKYDLFPEPSCVGTPVTKIVRLGAGQCNAGTGLYENFQCLSQRSTGSSFSPDYLTLNISSYSDYRTYTLPNQVGCQAANNHAAPSADFYFQLSSLCTTTPMSSAPFTMYQAESCTMPILGVTTSFSNMVNAFNETLSFSVSCPDAPAATGTPTRAQIELLGLESCTAETDSGIYRTLYFDVTASATCATIHSLNGDTIGYMAFNERCDPNNEFMTGVLYPAGNICATSTGASAFFIPLGSKRCYNLPTSALAAFEYRAVRARCPSLAVTPTPSASPSPASSALSYLYVEEFLSPNDCMDQRAEPHRSYAIKQDSAQCLAAPLWASASEIRNFHPSQFCQEADPVMFFGLDEPCQTPINNEYYAWKTTRNDGTSTATTTALASASITYPPQCNIGPVNGSVVATKVTCFGQPTGTPAAQALAVISKPSSTSIFNSGGSSTCYTSLKNVPGDNRHYLALSHACSPNDIAIKFSTTPTTNCIDTTPNTIAELNKANIDGSVLSCYQSPAAAARDPTSYVVVQYFSDSSCSVVVASVTFDNVVGACQTVEGFTIKVTETCYENDPFVRITSYSDSDCKNLSSNNTTRQGRDQCNFGAANPTRAYCIQPNAVNRLVSDPVSQEQAKVVIHTRGALQNLTYLIPNDRSVTSSSCLPVDDGSGTVTFYAKLNDGRCSENDLMTHITFFTDASCKTLNNRQSLRVGASHSNVMNGATYTVECFTAGDIVPPKPVSALFASRYADNGCISQVTSTSFIAINPGVCAPVEYSNSLSTPWYAKSDVYCDSAPIDSSGLKAMTLTYYTTPTCLESSRLDMAYLNPGYCAIDNVFAPTFSASNIFECLSVGSHAPPVSCQGTPPGPSFICTNGVYVLQTSYTGGTLTIPSSTQVVGNVTITESIVLSGTGASLSITGCLYLNGSVQIILTSEDLIRFSKTGQRFLYISYSSDNCSNSTDLSTVDVNLSTIGNSGCKKIKSKNDSTKQSLALTFTLDDSGCGTRWWIILVAVIGAVVLLVIVIVLVVTFVPAMRAKVRPFWVRSQRNPTPGNVQ